MTIMRKVSLLLFIIGLQTSSAFAKDWLLMTYPVDDAMLMNQVERVELHFNTPVILQTLELIAENGVVTRPSLESSVTASMHIMIPVPMLEPSYYRVHWQVADGQGEVATGDYHFWQH